MPKIYSVLCKLYVSTELNNAYANRNIKHSFTHTAKT